MLSPLPIDTILPEVLQIVRSRKNLVIEAAPGAGKTTRVPAALLAAVSGQVMVLEPRRIAARMAARRIAQETGTRVGDLVGFQVRFEDVTSPATRLRFLTEGLLTRRLLSDPQLRGVDVVVLDEFHERHLDTDVALALLRRLQLTSRPDLRLIVMSATLDTAPVAEYLGGCPVVRSEGRLYDVEISYRPHSSAPLEQQVSAAITDSVSDRIDGDVLVFLPGAAEIRRALSTSEPVARRFELDLMPLHGSLSAEDQDRAVRPGEGRKVILSTNVAESSITIEGVTVVIDSGLARVASDSTATGLPTLQVQRISKASATQRAGRAGRLAPGRAIRLYTADDFHRRPDHGNPGIRTRELSSVLLQLRALRATDLPWFEPPPQEAINAATDLLDRLTSHEDERELARYPVHPRVARLLGEAKRRNVARAACRIAAVLTSGERSTDPDAIHLLERDLSFAAGQTERQLLRLTNARRDEGNDDDVRIALLTAFPDRVARKRSETDAQMCSGRAAILPPRWPSDFLVAIDIEDRREYAAPLIRLASAIRPEWLLDLFPERIRIDEELVWNRLAERVETESRIMYDAIPVEETKSPPTDVEGAARILAAKAIEAGLHRFADPAVIESLLARSEFAARNSDLRALTMEDVDAAIAEMSYGLRSFSELQAASEGLVAALIGRLGQGGERVLSDVAPERVLLRGRQVKVHYSRGQQPYIASRLQDFFGLSETPRIGRGNVPLLVHLLAPNQRPVQVTADLAAFWQKLYPQVRKELSRRYPKHAWPENPA